MKKQAGLWIDHRKAVIVIISDAGEEIKEVTSNMEKHVRFSEGTSSEDGSTEDVRDRKFGNHLNSFFDEVITWIRDVETLQVFGPGEAKGELVKHLKAKGFKGEIVAIETMDKLTDHQISAKVREHFQA
jgi:hypothetical protein